jgi:hypothetical protein
MAQILNNILSPEQLDGSDYRKQFVEMNTDATDFVTADSSLLLSTVPFLPVGDSFTDIPLYPVGIAQQFSYNEGLAGQFIGEVGSSRKIGASGTAMGSGMISRLAVHGNSLVAALYRPTLIWIKSTDSLSDITDRIAGTDKQWIQGLNAQSMDVFDADLDDYVDRVISAGGMNSLLFKIPFGLIEIKRDPRQRVTSINFLEQCVLLGNQNGLSAGQFQVIDSMSLNFERQRPLKGIGPFTLSDDTLIGL